MLHTPVRKLDTIIRALGDIAPVRNDDQRDVGEGCTEFRQYSNFSVAIDGIARLCIELSTDHRIAGVGAGT